MEQNDRQGGGGKLTRRSFRPSRVSSASPYSRPPLADQNNKKSGWFSKLLASKVIPSLFGSSSSSSSKVQDQDLDLEQEPIDEIAPAEMEQEGTNVSTLMANNYLWPPKESDGCATTRQVGKSSDDCGIAEIEQQLQQKRFSKDETDHLIELLRSRTTGLNDDNGHVKASEAALGQKDSRKSTKEGYHVHFDYKLTPKSTDHFQVKANDVNSSPIEIAKAYMESRTPASAYNNCQTESSKTEKNILFPDNSLSKLPFSPAVKSPMRWPGAVAQSDNGYFTPRRGSMLHHPRTPYSTLFSKSTSKFQANAERFNRSSSKQSTAAHSLHHNVKNTKVRSVRDNFFHPKNLETASDGAGLSFSIRNTSIDGSSKDGVYKFDPANVVDEVSKFVAATPVHPQSSLTARKILEHLDRSIPSPKEKLHEIKLARLRVPPKSNTLIIDDQRAKLDLGIGDKHKEQQVLPGQTTSSSNDKDQISSLRQTNKQFIFSSTPSTTSSLVFQIPENKISISTSKPSEKQKTHDNGLTFTFPVPKTTISFSELPPTPTMASSLSASKVPKVTADNESTPLFSFGSNKDGDRLVFSFGSDASSFDVGIDAPVYKFGSEKKSCLSFKSLGGDAICY